MSTEIKIAMLIDRFGVEAIMGRPYLGYGEILRIQTAETIVRLYNEMRQYADWTDYKQRFPDKGRALFGAMRLASEAGLIDG